MTKDTGLLSLAAVARIHSGSSDANQIIERFAHPERCLTLDEIQRAGIELGFRVKRAKLDTGRLKNALLPAIGSRRSGQYLTLVRFNDRDESLVYFPSDSETRVVKRSELASIVSEDWLLFCPDKDKSQGNFGLRWFIPVLKRYRHLFAEVVLLSCVVQIFALMTPLFFQLVMDKVLVHRGFTTLDVLAIGFFALAIFDACLGGLRQYLFLHTANRVDVELGAKLFQHLIRLPLSYFDQHPVGHSVARVRELETIRNFITGAALTLIVDLGFTLLFFIVMSLYSLKLTLVVAASIPLYILLSLLITPLLRRHLDNSFQKAAANQALLVESVSGIETLKSLSLEHPFQRRWEEQLAGYVKSSFSAQNLNNIANQGAGFINKLTTLGIVYFGAHLVVDGLLTIGELVAFNMLAGRVSAPILKVVQLWQDFQQTGVSMRRLGDLLNTPTERSRLSCTPSSRSQGAVRFERVCFRYREQSSAVIEGVEFELKPGQTLGIVGRSGSGKSTLTKLLQRIYHPVSGRILIDDQDIGLCDLNWLRRNLGVVLQESRLFDGTIRENISITRPTASTQEILKAAQLAGVDQFVADLPEGYDYSVGEGGSNLSGGQRQRIAIARAIIADPVILIMDEATSALDYESEALIQRNMELIAKNRTLLIVAHRLASVRNCDQILVLDKGRITQSGTHSELIKSPGLYSKLWKLQTQGSCTSREVSYAV